MNQASFERILPVTGPVTLDVSTDAGAIRVRRGEPGSVSIRGVLRSSFSLFRQMDPEQRVEFLAANPPVEQSGNTIRVGDATDRWILRSVSFIVDILVPADSTVRALGHAADLQVEGIEGPVDCETDYGEILIDGIQSQVRASTDAGAIYIRRVTGPVEAHSDSGAIEAHEIGGRIQAKTDCGAISLSQTVAAPVYAESDSGAIRLKLAADGGYTVRVRSYYGRVEIPNVRKAGGDRRETEGIVRGGGAIVDLETDTGAVEVI